MSSPRDFFDYEGDELASDGVLLTEVARELGTPCYVYSASAFLQPLKALQKGLSGLDSLVCFAMKSNSTLGVLKLLANGGAGMDLVSGGELYRAKRAGVRADRIVFSGVGKSAQEIREALALGILSFNVESVAELELLNQLAGQMGKKAPVALRFNPDVDAKTHPYISTGLKKNKFGLNRREVLELARSNARYPNVEFRGLSIHIGSQILTLSPLEDAFRRTRALMAELDRLLPKPLAQVDLGGGLGIAYRNEKTPSLDRYCALVLKYFGPKAELSAPVRVILEPGRLLSGNAGVLLTQVLFRKARGTKDFLVVDAGMNDLIRPALYGSHHEIVPLRRSFARGATRKTDVVGPVCETADCFATDRKLSERLSSGDLLAVLSAGAYGFTMASQYNSRPRSPEVLIENGRYRVLRARESYEDLLRGETV